MSPDSEDPLRDALVSTRRYGATLNGLLSAIDSFGRGVEAARNANDALCRKLEGAQTLFAAAGRAAELRQGDLELRVQQLEQKLRSQRKAFEEERRFLTEEQDEFLRALLEEHEEQVAMLRDERDAALAAVSPAAPVDDAGAEGPGSLRGSVDPTQLESLRREVAALRNEREGSRALVDRMRTQRDQAQAALQRALGKCDEDAAYPTTPAPPSFAAGARLRVPPAPRTPAELADGLPDVALDFPAEPNPGKDGAPR